MNDTAGYKRFVGLIDNLLHEFDRSKKEYFKDWTETVLSNIDNPNSNISLETNGKLMRLNNTDGKLEVLYGDKLITLLREVRQLQSYGFKLNTKIDECARVGQKFLKHAMILKQVKTRFYSKYIMSKIINKLCLS